MFRAILVLLCTLWVGAATAQAQRELPAPSAPAAQPAAAAGAQPSTEPPPSAEPSAGPSAEEPSAEEAPPPPPPPPAPAPPPPARRYEGQVGGNESAPAYEEDSDKDEDKARDGDSKGSSIPGFSIRLDPFNWLIEGRLGIELEVVAWKFISIEAVPVLVASTRPPSFNFEGRDDPISQHSNGLGPIAGTSIGAGFWLSGKPLEGYVVRAIFTNYGFTYKASDGAGVFDKVSHTERRFVVYIGSHSRFGFFTISGGIGLGYELNQEQRCFVKNPGEAPIAATSGCPDSGELHIKLDPQAHSVADLNGGLHPIYLLGRFSLGVAFD